MNQPVSPAPLWRTWRYALWAAIIACAAATGLVACSGSDSNPPPFRELVLLAGTLDEGGRGRQDGVGTAARFSFPQGLALDAQGNLFVADTSNQLLRKITPAGVVSTVLDIATLPGPIDADGHETVYSDPTQVAFDPQGNLHVALSQTVWSRSRAAAAADASNPGKSPLSVSWVVLRVTPDGSVHLVIDPLRQYSAWSIGGIPTGLVFDAQGSFYIAGAFGCTIFKGDSTGQLSIFTQFGLNQDRTGCLASNSWTFGVASIAVDSGARLCFSTVDGKVGCTTGSGEPAVVAQIQGSLGFSGYRRGMIFDVAGNLYLSSINGILKLSPVGDWTTFAGNATVSGSDDGLGSAARFSQPSGLALDRVGNLFVADTGNATIRKISLDGRVSTVAGLAPQGMRLVDAVGAAARFADNFALATNGSGQIYVADAGHRVVRRIAPDGSVTTLAGAVDSYAHADGIGSSARFYGPYSIAVDSAGNALASDGADLRTISSTGEVRTLAFDNGGGMVDAVASGGSGTWLVVTHVMFTTVAMALNVLPQGPVAPIPNGYFTIQRLDKSGKATTLVGSSEGLLSSANAQGWAPAGLAGDDAGRVVFTLGHAVFELSGDGALSLLAGRATESGSADGTSEQARFASPAGVALDAAGNVYVADRGNHTIRKISRSGEVSTILGRAGQPGVLLGAAPGGLLEPRAVAIVPGGLVIATRQAVLLARP